MRRFTALFMALDATTSTRAKVAALAGYFRSAPPHDVAWAVYFLTGRKLKRLVGSRDLREAAIDAAGVPPWLFESCYEAVGDLAETIALLLPPPIAVDAADLATWVERDLAALAGLPSDEVKARLAAAWQRLDRDERFVLEQAHHRRVSRRRGAVSSCIAHWPRRPRFRSRTSRIG